MKEKTSPLVLEALKQYETLRDALPQILRAKPWWQRSVSVNEQVVFLKAVGTAQAVLEGVVARCHPAITALGSYSISTVEIVSACHVEQPKTDDAVDPVDGVVTG